MLFKDEKKIGLDEAIRLLNPAADVKKEIARLKTRAIWRVMANKITMRHYENLKTEKVRSIPSAPAGTHITPNYVKFSDEGSFIFRWAKTHVPGIGDRAPIFEPQFAQIEQKGYMMSEDPEFNLMMENHPKKGVDFERYDLGDKTGPALKRAKKAHILQARVYEMSDESALAALRACASSRYVETIPEPSRASADTARVALLRIINHPGTDLELFALEILDTLANDLATAVKKGIANKTVLYDLTTKTWTWAATGKQIVKNTTDEIPEEVLLNQFKKSKNPDTIIAELKSGLVMA